MYDVYRGGGGGGAGGGSVIGGGGGGDALSTAGRRNGFGSTYRNSRQGSRSRQRQQKASDIISGGGVGGGGYGGASFAGGAVGNGVTSSNYGAGGGASSFLPAPNRQDGGRAPLLRKQPGYVARGGVGRSKPSGGGIMGLGGSAMASAGSRAMASTMDPYGANHDRHGNNVSSLGGAGGGSSSLGGMSASSSSSMGSTITRRQRNGIGGASRKGGNAGGLPMIGDSGGGSSNSSVGSVASTAMPSRRRHRHGGGQHVHTGIPVTKSERSTRAGMHSIEGVKPGHANWSNQDNFLMIDTVKGNPALHTWGVFDGHGEHGHHVSRIIRERLGQIWLDQGQHLGKAFKTMQTELDKSTVDVRCSGATAVMIVMRGGVLEVANCGDSRAVLGKRTNGQVSAVLLTSDHKPDRPDERRRVIQAGGQVGCRQLVVGQNASGPVTLPLGPARVWYQIRGETMGLAMSRSLGDAIVHTMGVSADPEVTAHTLDTNDVFVIIATDGIWDVIDSAQAIQIVASHFARATAQEGLTAAWDVCDAATVLATTARRRWESLSPMVDDITAVVVDVRPHMREFK